MRLSCGCYTVCYPNLWSKLVKAIAESLYERSAHSTKYVRRRIPAAIRLAYPPKQTHVVRSLGTTDLSEAKSRIHVEIVKINAEFELKRQQLDLSRASKAVKRIRKLTEQQLASRKSETVMGSLPAVDVGSLPNDINEGRVATA